MEVLTFSFIRDERSPGRNGDLPHNNCLAFCCQLEAKPDAKNGKGRGDQSAVDFDGMFDDQELILAPPEESDQDSTDQPVHEDVALHKLQEDSLPKLSHPWRGRSYFLRGKINPRQALPESRASLTLPTGEGWSTTRPESSHPLQLL